MSVRVLSVINQHLVFSRLDIYEDGKLKSHKQKQYLMESFYASNYVPLVRLDGKQVMKGYIDEDTGDWIYDLSYEIAGTSIELCFVGCTKGWKGSTPGGEWGVILPRAEVKGKIMLNNKDIYYVNGVGYHDHNWGGGPYLHVNGLGLQYVSQKMVLH